MRFKTSVSRVVMADGHLHDRAEGILVDERASRLAKGRGRGNLYVLIELSGRLVGRDVIAGELADAVRNAYYGQRGSVTAGLQNAIRKANKLLYDENRDSMPSERRTAGISCAVLRDQDLFVAQAGPAALFVGHKDQATRFPETSPWLDNIPPEELDAAPLGERRGVHVDLFHTQVTDGDTILLLDTGSASRVPVGTWSDMLAAGQIGALMAELSALGSQGDLTALLVKLGEGGVEEIPAQFAAPADAQGRKVVAGPAVGQAGRRRPQLKTGEVARTVGRAFATLWAGFLSLMKQMIPGQLKTEPISRRQTITVKSSSDRRKKQKTGATASRTYADLVQKLLLVVAIAIPLIVGGVVAFSVMERSRSQKAETQKLWQEAQARWLQTQATDDRATVRALLTESQEFLQQVLERQPDHADALDLQERIRARLDESDQVRRVHWESDLMRYKEDAQLSRVVVEGVHVFVMDRNAHKVYHHQLDEFQQALLPDTLDTVIVQKGDQVGDILVGDLVDMVWMPVGNGRQKANLVILDSEGALLEYDPATKGLVPLRLAAVETSRFPQLVGSHSGRFYLLDIAANQIWRYGPTADGYSDSPDEWLQSAVDLAGVRDMGIGDSIYLLYADGTIQKLTAGKPDAFDISDWDTPPIGPTSIFARPPNDTQWIYVADPGNNRIVQTTREGRFMRQFRLAESGDAQDADALAGVTSLFVDEIGERAYFLSGNSLHMLVLPE